MRILMVASEVAPYAKSGGLGEVMEALPKALHRLGHDVRVFMPLHGNIDRRRFAFVPIGKPQELIVGNLSTPINFQASILSQEVPIYFLDSPKYFGRRKSMYGGKDANLRYLMFDHSVFSLLTTLDWIPDVIHCQDWHTGLVPNLLKKSLPDERFKSIASVFTIHNAAFASGVDIWSVPFNRQDTGNGPVPTDIRAIRTINFLKRGIQNADIVTTVSERYADELLSSDEHNGISPVLRLRSKTFLGIRNGVDYSHWNPMFDPQLPVNYDVEILHRKYDDKRALQHRMGLPIEDVPILGMNARVVEQKGYSLVFEIFDELMKQGVQLVVVGAGQETYYKILNDKMKQYPKQVAFKSGQPAVDEFGSLVYAGSDIFLMPSLFEPSGLGQMVSLRYGTIPIVRKTGGLADTITDYTSNPRNGNGFVFEQYTGKALFRAVKRALTLYHQKVAWSELVKHGMRLSYSWELPARKYVKAFRTAIKERRK